MLWKIWNDILFGGKVSKTEKIEKNEETGLNHKTFSLVATLNKGYNCPLWFRTRSKFIFSIKF